MKFSWVPPSLFWKCFSNFWLKIACKKICSQSNLFFSYLYRQPITKFFMGALISILGGKMISLVII